MAIRDATEDDAEAISALTRALTRKFISHEFPTGARRALDDALAPERVRGNMRGGVRYHVFEEAGEIVGVVAMRPSGHLLKLFVAEAAQGRGHARALWDAARTASRASGHIGPFTVSAALAAVAMYERFGFTASGEATSEGGVVRVPMRTS